jgi:hypothetical protein
MQQPAPLFQQLAAERDSCHSLAHRCVLKSFGEAHSASMEGKKLENEAHRRIIVIAKRADCR